MPKGLLHHVEIYVSDLKRTSDFGGSFLEELGYSLFKNEEVEKSCFHTKLFVETAFANHKLIPMTLIF